MAYSVDELRQRGEENHVNELSQYQVVPPVQRTGPTRRSPPVRSYENIDTNSGTNYRSNSSVDWGRSSFKVKKSKPGKVRYPSREEIFGIAMSFLLSLTFAGFLAACVVRLTPIVAQNFMTFAKDMISVGDSARQLLPVKGQWQHLHLTSNVLDDNYFRKTQQNTPLLFTTSFKSDGLLDALIFANSSRMVSIMDLAGQRFLKDYPLETFLGSPISNSEEIAAETLSATFSISRKEVLVDILPQFFAKESSQLKIELLNPHGLFRGLPFRVGRGRIYQLLSGELSWVTFRGDQVPSKGFDPTRQLEDLLGNPSDFDALFTHEAAYRFTQSVNQHVFIPEGWFYAFSASSSTSEVSGYVVALQYENSAFNASGYVSYLMQGNERLNVRDYPGAIKIFKLGLGISRNVLLIEGLASALEGNKQYLAAEEAYREVLAVNPRHVAVYSSLIQLLINHANRDVSESIADLLEQANRVGLRDAVLALTRNSI